MFVTETDSSELCILIVNLFAGVFGTRLLSPTPTASMTLHNSSNIQDQNTLTKYSGNKYSDYSLFTFCNEVSVRK